MCIKAKAPFKKLKNGIEPNKTTRNEEETNGNNQGENEPKKIQKQTKIPNENARKSKLRHVFRFK